MQIIEGKEFSVFFSHPTSGGCIDGKLDNKFDITCLKTSRKILYNTHNSAQAKPTAAIELQMIVTMLQ